MSHTSNSNPTQKLAKLMARVGYGSRRDCEGLITAGRVQVDGVLVDNVAERYGETVRITVTGLDAQQAQKRRFWCYYKPRGQITSHRDERGRTTVFDALPKELGRVVSVGRLDLDSEGLLLLTNDGGCAGFLERSDLPRRYRVRIQGVPSADQLERLADGIVDQGVMYAPIIAKMERVMGANCWLKLTLTEGKNREIRKVVQNMGFRVNRLIRTGFAGVELADLPQGEVRELKKAEVDSLGLQAE